MYSLTTPLNLVRGIGQATSSHLAKKNITLVGQLLCMVPLRYEDRANIFNIVQLAGLREKTLVTILANVISPSSQYKGRRSIQRAVAKDSTGRVKLMWFNSPYVVGQFQKNVGDKTRAMAAEQTYFISGSYDPKYNSIVAPTVEKSSNDTIHTNRLVPIYTSTLPIKVGSLRRVIKQILDNFDEIKGEEIGELSIDVSKLKPNATLNLSQAIRELHFPSSQKAIIAARERLALEEFLQIMKQSDQLKKEWQKQESTPLFADPPQIKDSVPITIPFKLTRAQENCLSEIFDDLSKNVPMNRLLIGDVGSGKTVVAGITARNAVMSGFSVALIAPTVILAEQHFETLTKLFPDVEIELLTSKSRSKKKKKIKTAVLYVGTHSIINKLPELKPAYVIYDEQQRFGVVQRSAINTLSNHPHILTMTATPIPRSLMLSIFTHLQVSYLDEMPPGRLSVKTWITPESKRARAYDWIEDQLMVGAGDKIGGYNATSTQVFVVCPFIDPSAETALENVANATQVFEKIKQRFAKFKVDLLHGRLKKTEQSEVIARVRSLHTQVLVTTPIVEVGVDLPAASIMLIENAERFGLSSLHQLRGRVGRSGQQGYCLLFSKSSSQDTKNRLKMFSNENKGIKLAEIDLQRRGSGDIFGVSQSGFGQLQFASWTSLELIAKAKTVYSTLPKNWNSPIFSLLEPTSTETTKETSKKLVMPN